ncbi:DNA polymerase-like protein [Bufonid herpesvirus 1]|uniref:DNA polymerase-like protein n=1 Tax=Bufonid herpesvirus 1 TaxID=2282206 RepID=UPI000EB741BF|nr:DNA polymerase-like protein [Bufonid herpesvirus 1]AXF48562.1 DNA polymerase-like protein [Bufonid herpesvirus 1]
MDLSGMMFAEEAVVTYFDLMQGKLPALVSYSETETVLFISSLRWTEKGFICAFNEVRDDGADPKAWSCLVTQLVYPFMIPLESYDVFESLGIESEYRGKLRIFDEDDKCDRDVCLICCYDYQQWMRAKNTMFRNGIHHLLFYRDNLMDGNMAALVNNIRIGCYALPVDVANRMPKMLPLSHLYFNPADDEALFETMHPHVYKAPFREAAFDIETIVDRAAVCRDYFISPVYVQTKQLEKTAEAIKEEANKAIPKSSVNPLDHGPITSIAVVVSGGYKSGSHTPKTRKVFYNNRLAKTKPEKYEGNFWVSKRAEFIACENEYQVIKSFLEELQNVNVLYVYNAEFDVKVITERVQIYLASGRQELKAMWTSFLSKTAEVKPSLHFLADSLLDKYTDMLKKCSAAIKGHNPKGAIQAHTHQYQLARDKEQSFRLNGFNTHIVDMYRLFNTQKIVFACRDRKLDTVAKHVLGDLYKNKLKIQKVGDIHYSEMDAVFTGQDPKELYKYLVYNLTDAELLMRMAKVTNPVFDFINRLRATKNIDVMHYGRYKYMYDGCVQSTRAVDVPLAWTRISRNRAVSVEKNAAEKFLPSQYTYPNKLEIKGGYVAEPLTGLNFTRVGKAVEITVDFASLYPSNMRDANIGPDAVIGASKAQWFSGWVVFDWSTIEDAHPLLTLMYKPDGNRYITTTSGSLENYLTLRNKYKEAMKAAKNQEAYKYNNVQQSEMKICANSHYGVARGYCQILITALGRHKTKLVEARVKAAKYVHNYGDTDSVMFDVPCGGTTKELAHKEVSTNSLVAVEKPTTDPNKWGITFFNSLESVFKPVYQNVESFLEETHTALHNDFLSRLRYIDNDGFLKPLAKSPHAENIKKHFLATTETKLCFENISTVVMRLQKKMYINLMHEPRAGDPVGKPSLKSKGVIAKKSSSVGPTCRIYDAFNKLIVLGGVIKQRQDFDRLFCVLWKDIEQGDCVLINNKGLFYRVKSVGVYPITGNSYWQVRQVVFEDDQSVLVYEDKETGASLNHVLGTYYTHPRCLAFKAFCRYMAFVTASALHSGWEEMVQYVSLAMQTDFQKTARLRVGLGSSKQNKIPFVKLNLNDSAFKHKMVQKLKGVDRQDPAEAFFGKYIFDTGSSIVLRDTLGAGVVNTLLSPSIVAKGTSRQEAKHILHNALMAKDATNTKLLGHVLLEYCIGETEIDATQAKKTLNSAHAQILEMLGLGARFHKQYFDVVPQCMKVVAGKTIDRFFSTVGKVATKTQASELPECFYGLDFPTVSIAEALFTRTLESALNDGLVITKTGKMQGERCITFEAKGTVYRVADDTANKTLLAVARALYCTTLFGLSRLCKRKLSSDECEQVPLAKKASNESLGPPPRIATKSELKEWFLENRKKLESQFNSHCVNCKLYWQRVDIPNLFTNEYDLRSDGLFYRKCKTVCISEMLA